MKRRIKITRKYLLIPVCAEKETRCVSFSDRDGKIYEFNIPVNDRKEAFYSFHYLAPLNMEKWLGETITVEGEVPRSFLDSMTLSDCIPQAVQSHPLIHFAPNTGWMNDPNGLIFQDGVYHLFFQYNPFDTKWENMCWGHAVSTDLLHWEQKETVLYPDGEGTMYSGSGIVNEKGLLGLPVDAQIYFYTCAGGRSQWSRGRTAVQKLACSTDGGETLQKLEGCGVKHLTGENRDPKVYWHEESNAYYMVLYLDQNDFMILRSGDLKNWKKSQIFTLDQAWECPDLRRIPVEGGTDKWVFWCADGFYYLGDFDGYQFKTDGVQHKAYRTNVPYAAQTWWGTKDVITIPWLRTKNKGKLYTGCMGLPRRLTLVPAKEGLKLRQAPVDTYMKARTNVYSHEGEGKVFYMMQKDGALETCIHMEKPCDFTLNLYGTLISYSALSGRLAVGEEEVDLGKELNEFSILADGELLEVSADNGLVLAVLEMDSDKRSGNVAVQAAGWAKVELYRTQ